MGKHNLVRAGLVELAAVVDGIALTDVDVLIAGVNRLHRQREGDVAVATVNRLPRRDSPSLRVCYSGRRKLFKFSAGKAVIPLLKQGIFPPKNHND